MRRPKIFYGQLFFTLIVCAFLIVPAILSALAGITENFFVGLKSGFTFRWIIEVWELYSETIYLSLLIAVFCLIINLFIGVLAAYSLARIGGRTARIIEEMEDQGIISEPNNQGKREILEK